MAFHIHRALLFLCLFSLPVIGIGQTEYLGTALLESCLAIPNRPLCTSFPRDAQLLSRTEMSSDPTVRKPPPVSTACDYPATCILQKSLGFTNLPASVVLKYYNIKNDSIGSAKKRKGQKMTPVEFYKESGLDDVVRIDIVIDEKRTYSINVKKYGAKPAVKSKIITKWWEFWKWWD